MQWRAFRSVPGASCRGITADSPLARQSVKVLRTYGFMDRSPFTGAAVR